jgi:hypothetical protein
MKINPKNLGNGEEAVKLFFKTEFYSRSTGKAWRC